MFTYQQKATLLGAIIWIVPIIVIIFALIFLIKQNTQIVEVEPKLWGDSSLKYDSNNNRFITIKQNQTENKINQTETKTNQKPIINNSNTPTKTTQLKEDRLWIVQIASFTQQNLAETLKNKINQKGYQSILFKQTIKGEQIYAIRLKYFEDKNKAKQTAKNFKQDFPSLTPVIYTFAD